jgi:mono/diheme cytochrome c family protein
MVATASRLLAALAPALVAGALVAGCGGGEQTAPMPGGADADDTELLAGRDVWLSSCASCHGAAGRGGVGPKLSDGVVGERFPDAEDQVALVTDGSGTMPAMGGRLTPEQIAAVVRYTREVL